MRYYNAATKQNPGHLIINKQAADENSVFHSMNVHKALPNYEAAQAYDVTGAISWYENGILYTASSIGSFAWKPLAVGEHVESMGINWSDMYFCTLEEATAWSNTLSVRRNAPRYDELGDTWHVHYHHFED